MTAETDLPPLPEPVAVKYPDSGLRDDEHALRLWAAHGYDTGGEPLFSAEQLREATAPLQAEIDALRTRLEDTVRDSTNKIEALRAEVAEWKRVAAAQAELHGDSEARAERMVEALREWWAAHRPLGWTEDQHRACPYVNLPTDTDKALAEALLRDQEEGQ